MSRRPPLALAAATTAATWGAIYSIGRWVYGFATFPIHEDVRYDFVAAEAGLRYGWGKIYDLDTLRSLSAAFPENTIGASGTFISPPPLAWLFAPLVSLPEPFAYLAWTVLSLAALVWAWYVAAPYGGLAKLTLLLLALALWPVMQGFYYGQPGCVVLALIAAAWTFMRSDRKVAAGVALALATALKPQVVVMIPICLAVAGQFRTLLAWGTAGAVIALASAASLGPDGLASFWKALQVVQSDSSHAYFTVAYLFGLGPVAYLVLILQGLACVLVAWRRRRELDIVFACGLLGSLMISIHLHQTDYINLVLASWLVVRGSASVAHKVWLAIGVGTMQMMSLGFPLPQLVWDAVWVAILALEGSRQTLPVSLSMPRMLMKPADDRPGTAQT